MYLTSLYLFAYDATNKLIKEAIISIRYSNMTLLSYLNSLLNWTKGCVYCALYYLVEKAGHVRINIIVSDAIARSFFKYCSTH